MEIKEYGDKSPRGQKLRERQNSTLTKSQTDKISNGRNPKRIKTRTDKSPRGTLSI